MIQNTTKSSNIITRATRSMKLSESDLPGGFETPHHADTPHERESTSATDKKQVEWISSEEEGEDYEQDEELKQF